MKACERCGKPVEAGRRKYCSDACADSSMRAKAKLRPQKWMFPRNLPARRFDYRERPHE